MIPMATSTNKTIWTLDPSRILDKDYKASIVLTNDTLTMKELKKSSTANEIYASEETRILKSPWRLAKNIKECNVKFTHVYDVDGGKAKLERGMCAGVENGKPVIYKVFARTDYANPMNLTKLDTKAEIKDTFQREASLFAFGSSTVPSDWKIVDKTDYKKLLGL